MVGQRAVPVDLVTSARQAALMEAVRLVVMEAATAASEATAMERMVVAAEAVVPREAKMVPVVPLAGHKWLRAEQRGR